MSNGYYRDPLLRTPCESSRSLNDGQSGTDFLRFRVQDHPQWRCYSLADVCVRGFERSAAGEPVAFESAEHWELLSDGAHADWWGSTNHEADSRSTLISAPFTLTQSGSLRFLWQASSEQDYDFLSYQLTDSNGLVIEGNRISGATDILNVELELPKGTYTITFQYAKDESVGEDEDRGFVRDLTLYRGSPMGLVIVEWPEGLTPYERIDGLRAGWTLMRATPTSVCYTVTQHDGANALAAYLRGLRFSYDCPIRGCIRVRVFGRSNDELFIDESGVQHHYLFVREKVSWMQAYNFAKQMTHRGLTGYLATITSSAESAALLRTTGASNGWVGAARMTFADGSRINDPQRLSEEFGAYSTDGDAWYWCDGPEAGSVFSIGKNAPVTIPGGAYADWVENEPNNTPVGESALMIKMNRPGHWNDELPIAVENVAGYYVEFSPYAQQKDLSELVASAPIPMGCMPCCWHPCCF